MATLYAKFVGLTETLIEYFKVLVELSVEIATKSVAVAAIQQVLGEDNGIIEYIVRQCPQSGFCQKGILPT